ncbi:vitamin B12-dependent ribonucleotide reductase [Acetivibrio clariflavus]|uniref:Vitamin B12-dependent ribonucleotide reductase n=1 Tax=Acetivibrio clariflavus (strain DSM 19732 / NBRC 101661 / EBR45) TaxID=720554 RepID=G8LWR6_ACECE|nr:vitamin B12-dependent ribonucleotide reductase [Acetivibrio clariflavus]AEV69777.1 ribonucleoside-diphosphate reductase class II [Acetivibrio clariflavus DSM 19732]
MNLTENAIKVLEKRYLSKDENGVLLEDPEGMFRRVAKTVALADKDYVSAEELDKIEQEFFDMMYNLEFLPNSPTLMNAGRPLGQLSACFVLPIEDTMEGIFETIKNAALIHKSGGGTGFSFSRLRPKGATVNSTGGVASGPVSFMKVFNAATEAVKQGGTRRGANMGILRVDHPDILEFITCKKDNSDITNFNISVGITEEFMSAVESGGDYDLVDPHSGKITGRLNAKKVFDLIVEMAWTNGEPGIIFLDRLNKDNVTPELGEIESTNPCGEQPLLPYEACNLGSINLSAMVKSINGTPDVDYDKLGATVKKAVHFLDNVIDVNKYPLPEIEEMTRGTRKIGLGVMGWADMLCKLNIPYNSEKAVKLAEKVMRFIQEESRKASIELAEKKGVFPYYEKSIYKDLGIRVRNATTTTIAPTGTLSIIAGVSSGIEPLFAISYIRNVMDNEELIEVNPIFKEIAIIDGFYSDDLMRRIANKGTIQGFPEIPKWVQNVFVTSHDISPQWHVRMQAAFQKYTDNAVSKTVNLRNEATREDVAEVFMQAYKTYCKGVTIYRDGSRDLQVLNIGKVKGKEQNSDNEQTEKSPVNSIVPRPRPEITTGFTEKVKIGCGNLYITVNYDENGICEVFTNTGRAGGCPSQSEATARLVSIALRSGIDHKYLVEQLKGIRCPSTIRQKGLKVMSCPDAIGRLIEKVAKIQDGNNLTSEELSISEEQKFQVPTAKRYRNVEERVDTESQAVCPECGKLVEHEGGCVVCRNCGFSKCG